ncbi:GATOR1 complex protein NPRL3-like [Oscarella lobularis]|uniref:GATOR1 complex protein NPRL3-like n=1 Tax=Oscarella lobularis TaxID=121494 RepID=UPI0033139CD6
MTAPLSVFLVTCGSRGDRLLFRYPHQSPIDAPQRAKALNRNPYALRDPDDGSESIRSPGVELSEYPGDVLAGLLTPKVPMCDQKFQLTVDKVTFVGHPSFSAGTAQGLLSSKSNFQFNIVFALPADASNCIILAYHDFVKRISIAFSREERRCGFMSSQTAMMFAVQDEVSAKLHNAQLGQDIKGTAPLEDSTTFSLILDRCALAQTLQRAFTGLSTEKKVKLLINDWINISFILPEPALSVYKNQMTNLSLNEWMNGCNIRPYHAVLLTQTIEEASSSLPYEASQCLKRLIQISSPLKSLQTLSQDADLPLCQVFELVAHLVYWQKAITVYPLCESNVYVLSPLADTTRFSHLVEEFVLTFESMYLPVWLSKFSLPTPLGEHQQLLGDDETQNEKLVQIVAWMLKRRLLIQLHTYVHLVPVTESDLGSRPVFEIGGESVEHSTSTSISKARSPSPEANERKGTRGSVSEWSELSSIQEDEEENGDETRHLLSHLSPSLREKVLQVQSASDEDDLRLFAKLCRYFDGKHHLEEIMYYENITRSQLLTILDKFGEIVITCTHSEVEV